MKDHKDIIYIAIPVIVILAMLGGVYYLFCTVRTPAITGVVIDKETKKPVENAWIMAVIETTTRNFGGENSEYYVLNRPHTRTDKEGRFSVPSHRRYSAPPPLEWGMSKTRLRIDVYAPGGKRGAIDIPVRKRVGISVPQDEEATIGPGRSLSDKGFTVMIPVKHVPMTIEEKKEDLGWLRGGCVRNGRFGFAWQIIPSDGCDAYELDYLIEAYERFADELKKNMNTDSDSHVLYWSSQKHLSSIYEDKGDYQRALELLVSVRTDYKKEGLTINLYQLEVKIKELQQKIKEKQ